MLEFSLMASVPPKVKDSSLSNYLKSIVSFSLITLISFSICFAVALLILYIWGLNDDTIRAGASIMFFGTIFVALLLGAFDD